MPQLLIELFSEDIPARMQARAAEDLQRLITTKLAAAGLEIGSSQAHSTPRRLALVVEGLAARTADVKEERKGPRVGSPEQAVAGFLRGAGLASLDQCEQRDTGKGVFWFAVTEKPGRDTAEVLPGLINETIREFPWPKSMRWATGTFRWVRPIHHILAVFDGKLLEGSFDLGGKVGLITFTDRTRGHRFLSPDAVIPASNFDAYRDGLLEAHVMLSRDERRAKIAADAAEVAGSHGLVVAPDEGLLDEVTGLVEWPVVLSGAIDQQFMDVPPEVLTTSMRTHQKYFATTDATGKLAPRFVVVANTTTSDGGAAVIAGNERVLRARLSDAKFFWDQDRKVKLEERVPSLDAVTFHAKSRHGRRKGLPDGDAGGRTGGLHPRRRSRSGAAGRPARQGRPRHRHGRGVPGASGRHGPLLCAGRRPGRTGRRRHRGTLQAARPDRPLPDGAGQRRRGPGRQAGYPRRILRDRREADRLQGPLRAPPRGLGRDPPDRGKRPAAGTDQGLRPGAQAPERRQADPGLRYRQASFSTSSPTA